MAGRFNSWKRRRSVRVTSRRGEEGRRPLFSFAWFTGADLRILARVPSERVFYNALGLSVVLLACGNGAALAIAVGYMLHRSAGHFWWLGLGWTLILACGIERLILQVPSTRRRWLPVVLVPRVALSLFLAVQLGEPLMLAMNQGAIDNRISIVQTQAIRAAGKSAENAHSKAIAADESANAKIQQQRNYLTGRIEHFRFRSQCEANTPDCSYTHQPGCQTWCQHFAHLEAMYKGQLATLSAKSRIGALNKRIAAQQGAAAAEANGRAQKIKNDDGLIAREEALSAIEKAHPVVGAEAWFLRLLFLTLDLLPLSMKILRMLATESPYEALAAAARKSDGVQATRENEASRIEEERIAEQARADVDFDRIRISLENERRIAAEEAGSTAAGAAQSDGAHRHAGADGPRVSAYSLGEFVNEMSPHENQRIAVDPRLARAGRVGTVLVAALALMTAMFWLLAHATIAGEWLVFIALGVVASLGVFTKWYVSAPRWALRPILASLVLGLSLPVVIVVMNL